MSKIALSMIIKDSEPVDMIARCLYSVAPYVDGLYLTITHKNTPNKANKLAKSLSVLCVTRGYPEPVISHFKWIDDFSEARNYSFSQVPEIFEWMLWLDVDDVLRGGDKLREVTKRADNVTPPVKAVFFNYLYRVEMDKDLKIKQVLIEHLRERLIRNDGSYKWIAPIHETLIEQRTTNKTDTDLCDVVHISSEDRMTKAIDRNIGILEKQLESQGNRQDPRTIYYLGKSYFDQHTPEQHKKAEDLIMKYLVGSDTNTPSGWDEERGQAWEYLSEIYRERGELNKAIKSILNALEECPTFPQFYISMALNYMFKNDWKKAKHWIALSQNIPYPKTTLVMNPRDMQVRVLEVLFNIAVNTNDLDGAWASVTKLKDIFPDDQSISERYKSFSELKENNEAAKQVVYLAKFLESRGQTDRLSLLAKALPREIENEPTFVQLRQRVTPPRVWGETEVAIVCGPGFEKWSPKNLDKGIGGSEEAVIYMSQELKKLGWKVTVYADPEESGDYDGVNYLSHLDFNPKDSFNVLVGWRNIGFFEHKWDAKQTYLWLHDVQNPMEYTKERVENITKIMVLSEAHKKTVISDFNKEWLPDDKFFMTSNGIDPSFFENKAYTRDPYRVFWGSSYDRGLEHLLNMWPEVKKAVPQANLHVYYGWNLFDTIHRGNPERMAWKAKINKLMEQDGVTHHGRVGQKEIAVEMMKSGVWAYPTHFYEISCITAMKAQAAGCWPVVTDYAALKETVQYGFKANVSENDIYELETRLNFRQALINTLSMPGGDRSQMINWALNKFAWKNVAKEWDSSFKR